MKNILILTLLFTFFPPSGTAEIPDRDAYLRSLAPGGSAMVLIPEGEYFTGDRNSADNSPPVKRTFKRFLIDIHPVTNIQFILFLDQTGYRPEGKFDRVYALAHPAHPVTGVTRIDAERYAAFAGKRLPTEWEWEIAARGLKEDFSPQLSRIYREKKGVFYSVERKGLMPVFSTPPNEIGLYDHIGNVFEWTGSDYPSGLLIGNNKDRLKVGVIRGGAWTNIRNDVTYADRTPFPAGRSLRWLGFRCVKDPGAG